MNIIVLGLWHLGCVTAACCARHFQVVGTRLRRGEHRQVELRARRRLSEPGLNELLAAGLAAKKLSFTTDPKIACARRRRALALLRHAGQ